MPPAIVRQNNPNQRRRASAGVGMNRSVPSSFAALQPKFDGGRAPPNSAAGASRREESSRIGSWTDWLSSPHAPPNGRLAVAKEEIRFRDAEFLDDSFPSPRPSPSGRGRMVGPSRAKRNASIRQAPAKQAPLRSQEPPSP